MRPDRPHRRWFRGLLPYPPALWRVVGASAVIFLSARVLIGLLLAMAMGPPAALHPSAGTHLLLVAGTAVLAWWARARSGEVLLSANLGTWPGWFWAASLLTAAVLALAVQSLVRAF